MTIYKYPLQIASFQNITMHVGAKILTAQTQGDTVCLWAMIDESVNQKEDRLIAISPTGQPFDAAQRKYIGTAMTHGGALVWHISEIV